MPSPTDQLALLKHLTHAGSPFVVIGGHAVNFHGYIRTTEDVDVVFDRTPESEKLLLTALQSIHAAWIMIKWIRRHNWNGSSRSHTTTSSKTIS
jgi:hypothetical protein